MLETLCLFMVRQRETAFKYRVEEDVSLMLRRLDLCYKFCFIFVLQSVQRHYPNVPTMFKPREICSLTVALRYVGSRVNAVTCPSLPNNLIFRRSIQILQQVAHGVLHTQTLLEPVVLGQIILSDRAVCLILIVSLSPSSLKTTPPLLSALIKTQADRLRVKTISLSSEIRMRCDGRPSGLYQVMGGSIVSQWTVPSGRGVHRGSIVSQWTVPSGKLVHRGLQCV